jgi:hypothetical protein
MIRFRYYKLVKICFSFSAAAIRVAFLLSIDRKVASEREFIDYLARRISGLRWNQFDNHPNVYLFPGRKATWPVGILESEPFPCIAVCEGGPDFLAAFDLARGE